MAASTPYVFLTAANGYTDPAVADYDYTLSIKAQGQITEEGFMNQTVHRTDDNKRRVVTHSTGSLFFISFPWNILSEANSGTIFDLYHDPAKAKGMARSFRFAYDGHTYVVVFDCKFTRQGQAVTRWGIPAVRFEIIGRITDA